MHTASRELTGQGNDGSLVFLGSGLPVTKERAPEGRKNKVERAPSGVAAHSPNPPPVV